MPGIPGALRLCLRFTPRTPHMQQRRQALLHHEGKDAEDHTLTLTVDSKYPTKSFLRYAALSDFANLSYAVSGSQLLGLNTIRDFVTNHTNTYTIKTPNGTFVEAYVYARGVSDAEGIQDD